MRIKPIFHVMTAWIMLVLTSEFSLTVAYDICDTNPWARILYVVLNIPVCWLLFIYIPDIL